jgi:hypothetical protein
MPGSATIRRKPVLGAVAAAACFASSAAAAAEPLVQVSRDQLCVTDGDVSATGTDGTLSVATPAMRAVVPASTRQDVEAHFVYLGATDPTVSLGSGAVREQFGLKLRAADPCNLVYAMWRFAPTPGVVVQLKSNPDAHDSQTCGNNGYRTIRPSFAVKIHAPPVGQPRRLKAEMEAGLLKVSIDGRLVWQGDVDGAPADGAVGIRSDNAQLALTLFAPIGSTPSGAPPPHCRPSGGD